MCRSRSAVTVGFAPSGGFAVSAEAPPKGALPATAPVTETVATVVVLNGCTDFGRIVDVKDTSTMTLPLS